MKKLTDLPTFCCAWGCVSGIPGQPDNSRAGFTKRDLLRLQAVHSKAVRLIHYSDRMTPTKELMKATNMLSINQYIAYQIIMHTFKIKVSQLPEYHYRRLFDEEYRPSRTRTDGMKRIDFRLDICRNSFFYQASKLWTALPANMKSDTSITSFKRKVLIWIEANIPVKP